jgi:hypothetical protein
MTGGSRATCSADAWAYVSGLCEAREAAFLQAPFFADIAALRPEDAAARLSRTFFGPVARLEDFDTLAEARRNREFDDIGKVSPDDLPVKLARLPFAAARLHRAISGVDDDAACGQMLDALVRGCLAAGDLADEFYHEFEALAPPQSRDTRIAGAPTAASLLADSAELLIALRLAECTGDAVIMRWADAHMRAGCNRVARRALNRGIPRAMLGMWFFRGALATREAADFLSDYTIQAAERLAGGAAEASLLAITASSKGEPFSPGRVLHYLLAYLEQERRLRAAVYASLGNIGQADRDALMAARLAAPGKNAA